MSSPSIRILDDISALPDIEIAADVGATIDIGSVDALDMGLLANQKKIGSPARPMGSSAFEIKSDDIEFVNLDDVGKPSVSFDIQPNVSTGTYQPDSIRILRGADSSSMPPARPITAPVPQPAMSLQHPSMASSGSGGSSSGPLSGIKSWFTSSSSSSNQEASSGHVENAGSSGGSGGFRSWFGGSGSGSSQDNSTSVQSTRPMEFLTPEQEFAKKSESLTMLERMDRKGITGNKMTMANTLEEIQGEVERRKDSKALEASVRFQRSMLTTVTNGMEFLNSRFDPLGVKLDGWSEQVNENIEDYDEIFEELYDKYKDKSKVAPEVRLIMSLGLSAAMCHVTNTMFKSRMPGMDDILRNNPGLAQQFAQAAAHEAVGPGFANFVSMGMSERGMSEQRQTSRRPSAAPQPPPSYMPPPSPRGGNGMFQGMSSMMGGFGSSAAPVNVQANTATARREMAGPTGVEDILRTLNQAGEDLPPRSVPPPASPQLDAEDIQSIASGYTTATARAAGKSRRRTTAQPVGATLTLNV